MHACNDIKRFNRKNIDTYVYHIIKKFLRSRHGHIKLKKLQNYKNVFSKRKKIIPLGNVSVLNSTT